MIVARSQARRGLTVATLAATVLLSSGAARAEPLGLPPPPDLYAAWWTGSLLASGGRTQGAGHTYVFGTTTYSDDYGSFDDAWHYASRASSHVVAFGIGALAGITDRLDLGVSLASYYKRSGGHDSAQFGDLGVKLAFQVLRSINGSWIPDILVYVKETFPTGRYERLDPTLGGVDAGGAGTYATTVGLNLQKLLLMPNRHLLKLRANFAYQYSTKVDLHGIRPTAAAPRPRATSSPAATTCCSSPGSTSSRGAGPWRSTSSGPEAAPTASSACPDARATAPSPASAARPRTPSPSRRAWSST